jgi:glycosyltransferase involved in cell wall biosynthesis
MVQRLEKKGITVRKAVKTCPTISGYLPFYMDSISLALKPHLDILQAHYIPHSSVIPALLKLKRPLVLKFHGDDGRIYPFVNKLNRLITLSMIRRADHLIATSEEIRGKLIGLGVLPENVTSISSGVDTDHFKPADSQRSKNLFLLPVESPVFLYVGRIHPWKGVHEILSAACDHPDSLFVFAGPGNIPPHPDNCRFLGELPPKTIPPLINAADVSLLPSYTEGISNFIMESLSCEVPVIATHVGGTPEIIHHHETGLLIPPKNYQALSHAISWMKEHENERKAMGKNGRIEMITHYNEDLLINRMIAIHQELLK